MIENNKWLEGVGNCAACPLKPRRDGVKITEEHGEFFFADFQDSGRLHFSAKLLADRMPIGRHAFGGPKGKKFKYKQLEELLMSISSQSLNNQKNILNTRFEVWRGNLEQIDDVTIIGIRI